MIKMHISKLKDMGSLSFLAIKVITFFHFITLSLKKVNKIKIKTVIFTHKNAGKIQDTWQIKLDQCGLFILKQMLAAHTQEEKEEDKT